MVKVKSPCTKECDFDEEQDICLGCLRTLDELRAWRKMTDQEKRNVLDRIKNKIDESVPSD